MFIFSISSFSIGGRNEIISFCHFPLYPFISPTCTLDNILARYDGRLFSVADSDSIANPQC